MSPEIIGAKRTRTSGTTGPVSRRGNHHSPIPASLPIIPGYEIIEVLGNGAMGVVYKAHHVKLDRNEALKMIRSRGEQTLDPAVLDRFLQEARAVAQFKHDHVVQIYNIGEHKGQPYFSMEWMEGGALNQKLAGTPQPAAEAAALVEKVARAVQKAHEQGIIHRDLKPGNILLT